MDELETRLRSRDRRFLWRVAIAIGAMVIVGAFIMSWVVDSNLGGCVARGFQTMTGS